MIKCVFKIPTVSDICLVKTVFLCSAIWRVAFTNHFIHKNVSVSSVWETMGHTGEVCIKSCPLQLLDICVGVC